MKWSVVLITLLLIGCSAPARLDRIYNRNPELRPHDTTTTVTIVRDSIVYKDSVVFVRLPADTAYISGEVVYLPTKPNEVKIRPDTLFTETDFAKASAWITQMRLNLLLIDKDTTLFIRLDSLTREAHYWKEQYNETITTVKETHIPRFYDIMTWVGVGMVGLLIGAVLFRIFK